MELMYVCTYFMYLNIQFDEKGNLFRWLLKDYDYYYYYLMIIIIKSLWLLLLNDYDYYFKMVMIMMIMKFPLF